jgi:hypothetical protein
MPKKISHIFPMDFLHKLINFPKETLANLFQLCQESVRCFIRKELHALDPLVCENACHIRAFALWQMTEKYNNHEYGSGLHMVVDALEKIIKKTHLLPEINEKSGQTIEQFLQENQLYLEIDEKLFFDVKFLFLCYLLTLTKRQFPSSTFMLHEKTCPDALNISGLVHNKTKSLVSSAQKELSAMSCLMIQNTGSLLSEDVLTRLLVTRYDDHRRSYLPQYSTAKVILSYALQHKTPLIIKVSRYVKNRFQDEINLCFIPSSDKRDFVFTPYPPDASQVAIVFGGIINYSHKIESSEDYAARLNNHSIMQVLLANFAAHPQFSGNLRNTPCIYKEAIETMLDIKPHIAQEWEEFSTHVWFARKEGCSSENPDLLFLNHVFCDSLSRYKLTGLPAPLQLPAQSEKY